MMFVWNGLENELCESVCCKNVRVVQIVRKKQFKFVEIVSAIIKEFFPFSFKAMDATLRYLACEKEMFKLEKY